MEYFMCVFPTGFVHLVAYVLISIKWKRQLTSMICFIGLYCQGTPRKREKNSDITDKSQRVYSMASHLLS